jgi:hypothetical protein
MGHLLSLGHQRIGLLLGPDDHIPSNRKLEAARVVAAREDIPLPANHIVRSLYSLEAAQAAGVQKVVAASSARRRVFMLRHMRGGYPGAPTPAIGRAPGNPGVQWVVTGMFSSV